MLTKQQVESQMKTILRRAGKKLFTSMDRTVKKAARDRMRHLRELLEMIAAGLQDKHGKHAIIKDFRKLAKELTTQKRKR